MIRYRDIVIESQTTKIPIEFGPDLYEWLRESAHRQRRSMAALVREAVRDYRQKIDPQLRLPIGVGAK